MEHVRLLLQAVIEMKRSLEQVHGKANIRDDGPCDLPMEPLPAPVENAAEKPPSRASSEALGQRWPPSSETVEVPEPPTAPAPLPAPEAPPAAPESPETPAPAPWREEVPGTVPPPTAPPAVAPMAAPVAAPVAAPAEVSDTGQMDLLQLLNTQAHQEQPAPEVKVETTAAEAEPEGPAAKDATGRSVLTRTLQLPGLAEAPAPEDSAGAGTAAPAVSAGVQRTSIAAALWQTTPEEPAVPEVSVAAAASAAAASAANAAAAAAAADVSDETKDSDEAAFAMLNRATAQLQQNRLSHSEAAETFSELVAQLPPGRLRCSALLNRAHCYVGMGKLEAALSDIETITQGGPTEDGFDPKQWHKVWMSRGGIRRKLAQLQGSEELYAQSKADYEYVLSIRPLNESYVTKARRCLQQLASRESERGRSVRDSEGKLQASPSPKRRRLDASRSRSRSPAIPAPSTALAATAAETAPDTARGPKLPLGSKALQALPEDAAAAGRRLFWEGAVSRPSLSGPSSSQRRYEVSVQGVTEVVQLHATESSWCGSCSCRLSSHCKHVAAALCALEQEEKTELPADPLPSSGVPAMQAPAACGFRLEQLARQLERKTNDELKNYLRLNQQLLSGPKAELAQRLAENALFGALAPCPRCGGHLHPEEPLLAPNTTYYCKRQLRDREACGYEASGVLVERRPFLGAEELLKGIRG